MGKDPVALGPPMAGASAGDSLVGARGRAAVLRVLDNPVMGFAPWILFSVIEGPGRFDAAAGAALGAAVVILLAGLVVGVSAKLLDLAAIVFFAVLLIIGWSLGHEAEVWLERWAGEISNVMIVLVALGSIVVRRPFTLQYARESTDPQYWESPLFLHVNDVLTWVWTAAFFVTAVVGWYGDGPLHEPDNIWTNWIVSIAVLIFAIRFTEWYPVRARAVALRGTGAGDEPDPRTVSVAALLMPLAAYLVPIGIVFLAFDATPWWIGVSLIVIGATTTRHLKQDEDSASSGGSG